MTQPANLRFLTEAALAAERAKLAGIAAGATVNRADSATDAAISTAVGALVGGASAAYDTLGELATQLASDENAAAALATLVGTKAPLASPAFTGTPTKAGTALATTADVAASTLSLPVNAMSANGTAVIGARNSVNASAGPIAVTLPTPTAVGQHLIIERADTSAVAANAITITGTIRGAAGSVVTLAAVGAAFEGALYIAESLTSWAIASSIKPRAVLDAAYQTRASIGDRMRRASAAAFRRNSPDLGVMASPPTVIAAGGTNPDATLTKAYRTSTGQTSTFRVTGGLPTQGTGAYANYLLCATSTMPSGSGGNLPGDVTRTQGEWAVEFETDAPKVMLRLLVMSNVQIEVNDQPVAASALVVGGGGTQFVTIDFAGVSAVRKFRIEMPGSGFDGVNVGPTYTVWPPRSETNIRVCTVGDSVDQFTGVDVSIAPNGGWQKVAGKLLGWTDVRVVSFGGTGFVNPGTFAAPFNNATRVADVAARTPELLIISGSQNDDTYSAAAIQAAVLSTLQTYRAALPTVPIVLVGVDNASNNSSAARLANDAAVKAGFDQWADSNSWFVPNVSDPTGPWFNGTGTTAAPAGNGNRDRYGTDGSHPNTAGHAYFGRRFATAFRTSVLPYLK